MTTLYKKIGLRYKPAAEHEEWGSYPAGAHLVICQPGSTLRLFNVDPDRAGLLAAAVLRQYNAWRRGNMDGAPQPDPREIGKAIDAAVEMIERLAALPARITPEQAPDYVLDYCHEATEGYADGWNDCTKAMGKEAK